MAADTNTNDWTCYQSTRSGYRSLHAMRKIRQGETITELPTEVLDKPDMYSIEIMPGVHINCEFSAVGATNHSCAPNAAIKGNRLVAWNCIEPGEEITIDYKRTESKLSAPFDCKCGRLGCRGRIE